jgi:hypothetical protein
LCRREGIPTNLHFRWSKDSLEACRQCLVGDTERQADTRQVTEMRAELDQPNQLVAELSLKNRVLTPDLAAVPWKRPTGQGAAVGQVALAPHCVPCSAGVRRSPAEKREISHLIERSALPVGCTLDEPDVPHSRYSQRTPGRFTAGTGSTSRTGRGGRSPDLRSAGSSACPGGLGQGNRLPKPVCDQIVQMALAQPEEPARQLAWLFTDQEATSSQHQAFFGALNGSTWSEPGLPAGDRRWPFRPAHPPGVRTVADRLQLLQDPGLRLAP